MSSKVCFHPLVLLKKLGQLYTQQLKSQKGLVLLRFESETDAHKALEAMNGRIVNGRLIFVEVAKNTE